ncbi:M81 family metallopeptidase [Burkholderia gladioli]|uniref:M81 family metallopeptidase n=2 Tax=Burkholderia gladioli TaxID=28095 RepID=UPI0016421B40|nr:M81 family metallopeptidase [Burkholderia gladioli]
MMKLLIAGLIQETNTSVREATELSDFSSGVAGPILRGTELVQLRSVNVPTGGLIDRLAGQAGVELIPVVWAQATPGGPVDRRAFDLIVGEIVRATKESEPDAVFLDLHGAMVVVDEEDGDGEILRRVRAAVGDAVPIIATLDLHANTSAMMFETADELIPCRTYPHVDLAEIGRHAAERILDRLRRPLQLHRGIRRVPYSIAIEAMETSTGASKEIYQAMRAFEAENMGIEIGVSLGFPLAEVREGGPCLWAYGQNEHVVEGALAFIYSKFIELEQSWKVRYYSTDQAVRLAIELLNDAKKPIVLADTLDNPGAGAAATSTALIEALCGSGIKGAAVGLLYDPLAAREAHAAGLGASLDLVLSAGTDQALRVRCTIEALSDGRTLFSGPMWEGAVVDVGPSACLNIDGVRVAVASARAQMFDVNLFRMVGIEPSAQRLLVCKSSVHFRAAFEPLADTVLVVKATR